MWRRMCRLTQIPPSSSRWTQFQARTEENDARPGAPHTALSPQLGVRANQTHGAARARKWHLGRKPASGKTYFEREIAQSKYSSLSFKNIRLRKEGLVYFKVKFHSVPPPSAPLGPQFQKVDPGTSQPPSLCEPEPHYKSAFADAVGSVSLTDSDECRPVTCKCKPASLAWTTETRPLPAGRLHWSWKSWSLYNLRNPLKRGGNLTLGNFTLSDNGAHC